MIDNFEQVYAAALAPASAQNHDLLTFLSRQRTVDVLHPIELCTAAEKLASEGRSPAVEKLIRYGANIDYAARGYAKAAHLVHANELVSRGASVHYVMDGLVRGGYSCDAARYARLFKADPDKTHTAFYTPETFESRLGSASHAPKRSAISPLLKTAIDNKRRKMHS